MQTESNTHKPHKGGRRLSGFDPRIDATLPLVSVITVVFNAEKLLEHTIIHTLEQTYPNIEYLIIDGGSNDGTIDIIEKYDAAVDYWIAEPDEGLYDAMNKGLQAATGDYVWFINAGDLILKPMTTAEIFAGENEYADIYYGDTMIIDTEYKNIGLRRLRPPEVLTPDSFKNGMLVCHQSILVKLSLAERFDLKYKHSADFDWVLKALFKAKSIHNTHQILSAFLDGGQSKQNIRKSLVERFQSMSHHFGFWPSFFRHIPIAFRFFKFWSREGRF